MLLKIYFLAFCLIHCLQLNANGSGTTSWYYRGTAVTSNKSLSLNVGDSFVINCLSVMTRCIYQGSYPTFIVMFASSSTSNPSVSLSFTIGQPGTPINMDISATSGTIIYDSYFSTRSTWDHWLFFESQTMPYTYAGSTNQVPRARLTLSIPNLISTDAGTIYCAYAMPYYPAAVRRKRATTSDYLIAYSNGFTLSLATTSNSLSKKSQLNNFSNYAIILLGSAKLII